MERIELELPKGLRFRTIALTRTLVAALPRLSDTLLLMRARADRSESWAALRSRDIAGARAGFWSLAPTPGVGDEIMVFDVRRGSVLRARISGRGDGAIETSSVRLQSDAALLGVSPFGRRSFIATGLFQRVMLGVFDSTGALRDLIGAPPVAHDTVPIVVRQHAHQGKVVADSMGERVAVASIRGAVLSILRKDGRLIARAGGRATFEPSYVWRTIQGHPMASFMPASPLGYIDLSAGSLRLVALFSGSTRQEPGELPSGSEVHEYDWNGQCLARYRSARGPLQAISIHDDKVYGLRNGEPAVIVELTAPAGASERCHEP